MINLSLFNYWKPFLRKVRNRMNYVSYIFHEQIFHSRSLGFNNIFLDGFVDIVDELIFMFDAFNDPVIHLVCENSEETIIL